MKGQSEPEMSEFRISSDPISGPRPCFLASSLRGSRSPASAGPIPARAISGLRTAAECRDADTLKCAGFVRSCGDGETSRFYFVGSWSSLEIFLFRTVAAATAAASISRLVADLRYLFDLSASR